MRVTVDEHGTIDSFPYHDGHLDAVLLGEDHRVHLALRCIEGERRVLTLIGVTQLSVDSFAAGNIVTDSSPITSPTRS